MHISMGLGEPTKVRRRVSLTPLVDVIFLLLMFFMLSSTFSRFAELDLMRQSSASDQTASAARTEIADVRAVVVTVSADRGVRINGEPAALEELAARLDEQYHHGARTAVIVADSTASVQDLVSVLERARGSSMAVAVAR